MIVKSLLSILLLLSLSMQPVMGAWAIADAAVGGSTLFEGYNEATTGQDHKSGIEKIGIEAGLSDEDASKLDGWIRSGVAVITVVHGCTQSSSLKTALQR